MANFTAISNASNGSSQSSSEKFFESMRESGKKHGLSVCAMQLMEFSSIPVRTSFANLAAITPVYDLGRNLANMGIELMNAVRSNEEWNRLLKIEKPGTVMNNLEVDNPFLYSYMLGLHDISLNKVHYCQQRLCNVPTLQESVEVSTVLSVTNEDFRRVKSIINHDYIVLDICIPMPNIPTGMQVYVRAEKVGQSDKGAGILINWEKERVDERCTVFHMNCNEKRLSFKDLEAVLEAANPNYSLKYSCCWDYAKEMAENVLKHCQQQADTSEEERRRLEKEIRTIKERISVGVIDNALDDLKEFILSLIEKVVDRAFSSLRTSV